MMNKTFYNLISEIGYSSVKFLGEYKNLNELVS